MSYQNFKGKIINKKYRVLDLLGVGGYGIVLWATNEQTQQEVAIKIIKHSKINETPKLKQLVQTQIKVLRDCNNQNIIKYIASFQNKENVYIVTQYCNGGDLQQYLDKKKILPEDQATQFLKQILNGFKGMHQVKAMHRDFKLANLLLHNNCVKIADFGFAKLMQESNIAHTILGTQVTMAPELLNGKQYGMTADIWSIGVVYYQMIHGKYPFPGRNIKEIKNNINKYNLQFPQFFEYQKVVVKNNQKSYVTQRLPIKISKKAIDFIKRCLTVDPSNRISWTQIYEHQLITEEPPKKMSNSSITKVKLEQNKLYYKINQNKSREQNQEKQEKQSLQQKSFITQGYSIKQLEETDGQGSEQKILWQGGQNFQDQLVKQKQNLQKNRTSIMLIIQFLRPKIQQISKKKAAHNVTIFLICKKTLIDLQRLLNEINTKKDSKNQNYFILKQFFTTSHANTFMNRLLEDVQKIKYQMQQQIIDLRNSYTISDQIKRQCKNPTQWLSQAWQVLLDAHLERYWFQLAQNFQIQDKKASIVAQILRTIEYYRTTDQIDIQVFQKIIQTLDIDQLKEEIDKKLYEIYNQ